MRLVIWCYYVEESVVLNLNVENLIFGSIKESFTPQVCMICITSMVDVRTHTYSSSLLLSLSIFLSLSSSLSVSHSLSPLSLSLARSVLFFFFFKYHGNWVLTYSVLKLLVISCDLLKICPLAPRSHLVVFRNNLPHIQIGQVFIPSHEYPRRIYIIAYSATCEISEIGFSGRVSVLRPTSLSL